MLTEVTQGDMTQRVGFKSQNEFGQLASQINLLIHQMGMCSSSSPRRRPSSTAPPTTTATTESVRADLEKQRQETASVAAAMTQMRPRCGEVAQATSQTWAGAGCEKASEMGRKGDGRQHPPPISSRASCSRPAR